MAAGRGGTAHRGSGQDSGCGRRAVSSSGYRHRPGYGMHRSINCNSSDKEAASRALAAGLHFPKPASKVAAFRMPTRPVPAAKGDLGYPDLVGGSRKSSRPGTAPEPWPAQAAMLARLQEAEVAAAAAEASGTRRRRSCPGSGRGLSRPGSNTAGAHQEYRHGDPPQCKPGLEFFQEGLQGTRSYMEDRILVVPRLPRREDVAVLGVFDGHGGSQVAQLATELLPEILTDCLTRYVEPVTAIRECFLQLDEEIRRSREAALLGFDSIGCTANVIVVIRRASRLRLFCANSGDSRAVLSRAGVALELSQDHKPHDPKEKRRIEAAGGFVTEYEGRERSSRVDGTLAVSRALGDFRLKARLDLPPDKQKVIALPDIKEVSVGACDEYVAVGSDGVFSVFTSEVLISKLGAARRAGHSWQAAIHEVLERSAAGQDNASLCVARFVH